MRVEGPFPRDHPLNSPAARRSMACETCLSTVKKEEEEEVLTAGVVVVMVVVAMAVSGD